MIKIDFIPAASVDWKEHVCNVARVCTGSNAKVFDQKLFDRLLVEDAGGPSKPFDFVGDSCVTFRQGQGEYFTEDGCRLYEHFHVWENRATFIISGIPRFVADHLRTHSWYGQTNHLMYSCRLAKASEYYDYTPLREWLENNNGDAFLTDDEHYESMSAACFRAEMQKITPRKEIWNRSLSDWKSTTIASSFTEESFRAMVRTRSGDKTQKETRELIARMEELWT